LISSWDRKVQNTPQVPRIIPTTVYSSCILSMGVYAIHKRDFIADRKMDTLNTVSPNLVLRDALFGNLLKIHFEKKFGEIGEHKYLLNANLSGLVKCKLHHLSSYRTPSVLFIYDQTPDLC